MKYWFNKIIHRLRKYYPPFRNHHFWAIQLVAIPIAALHTFFEISIASSHLEWLYFIPISLLVVPVVYAALNFGFSGSIGTAIWVVVLTIPDIVWIHDNFLRLGEVFQLAILLTMAFFMGQRVDRENNSRSRIESANAALAASEMKYRTLFDSCPRPILLLDNNNAILDLNPAAGNLFGKSPDHLKGQPVTQLGLRKETNLADPHLKDDLWEGVLLLNTKPDSVVYLEPTFTRTSSIDGNTISQIHLTDITEEHNRQAGLKAYTAFVLRALEDERLHIARELHDDTIQNLSLLCRQLDNVIDGDKTISGLTAEELRAARTMAEKVVRDLRDFAKALRPSILDDLGMVASVRRLLVDFLERADIKGQLTIFGKERRLSRDIEINLFRIAQEALWNVEHHADAAYVNINIYFNQQETKIEIIDDGIGFEVPPVIGGSSTNEQLGLVGMQERAELCGGQMEIYSNLGKGTTVSVSIPNNTPLLPLP